MNEYSTMSMVWCVLNFGHFFYLYQTQDEWAEILYQVLEYYSWAWFPFIVFIVITGFVVVNLMIAVICDAVHVLGKDVKEGLVGSETSSYPDYEPQSDDMAALSRDSDMVIPPNYTQQRLEELQMQLDDMVILQGHMQKTIELLIRKIKDNAANEAAFFASREAESIEVSIEDKSKEGKSASPLKTADEPTKPILRTFVSEGNSMCHSVKFDASCDNLNLSVNSDGKEVERTRSVSFDKEISQTHP